MEMHRYLSPFPGKLVATSQEIRQLHLLEAAVPGWNGEQFLLEHECEHLLLDCMIGKESSISYIVCQILIHIICVYYIM